jgi:hypothetical protein
VSFGLLCDTFWDHPKVVAAGNEAVGVWVRAKGYCDKQLTDGFVPDGVLAMIAGPRLRVLKAALLRETLFDQAEGGVLMHDYLKHNPSKAEVLEKREAARQKKAAQRAKGAAAAKRGDGGRYVVSPDVSPGDSPGDTAGDAPGDGAGDSQKVSSATHAHAHPTEEKLSRESFSRAREGQHGDGTEIPPELRGQFLVPQPIPDLVERDPVHGLVLLPRLKSHARKCGCTNPEAAWRHWHAERWKKRGERRTWCTDWLADFEAWLLNHGRYGCPCQRQPTPQDAARNAAGRQREAQAGGRGVVVRHPESGPAPLAGIIGRLTGGAGQDAEELTLSPEQREELRREELRRQREQLEAREVAS